MIAIAIGSNVEPEKNIPAALERLAHRVEIIGLSNFYRTEPVGPPGQPPFVNGACAVHTPLGPHDLKRTVLREVEHAGGRERTADKYAPRTIDLDLLIHGALVLRDDELDLPDPEILDRPFLWLPLLELDPNLMLPGTDRRLADLTMGKERTSMLLDAGLTVAMSSQLRRGME